MSKSLPASKKLMQNYLSELLTEEPATAARKPGLKEKQPQPIESLLEKVSIAEQLATVKPDTVTTVKAESQRITKTQTIAKTPFEKTTPAKEKVEVLAEQPLKTRKSAGVIPVTAKANYRDGNFQAMFFEVAGLLIAVPLIELGGIHNTDKTTPLMGKPDWFKGVMISREEKINVVDTALWVMPEKCDQPLLDALNYQYIIMLNNSPWGLLAENLVDTVTLNQNDVKWLDGSSKRPWLAGLVKDRMCALIDVNSLIQLLDDGANITRE